MDTCRFCGCNDEKLVYRDVFNYIYDIKKVLPIVVMKEDNLPSKLCSECVIKLYDICRFYDQILRLEEYFRKAVPCFDISAINSCNRVDKPIFDPNCQGNNMSNERFIVRQIENAAMYLCKICHRTYVSESSACNHICNSEKTRDDSLQPVNKKNTPNILTTKDSKIPSSSIKSKVKFFSKSGKKVRRHYYEDASYYAYIQKSSITESEKRYETTKSQTYDCRSCGQTFSRRAILVAHEHDHLLALFSKPDQEYI